MIYLDYSATTPVDIDVFDTLSKVTKNYIGNPNSMHSLGQKSMELLESATKQIADIFGVSSNEIVYTGGSTESNNMAIIGAALANHKKGKHIIVSKLEHPSIYVICDYLKSIGFEISYVKNDSDGLIDFDDLKEERLLQEEEYASLSWGDQPTTVDYGLLYGHKFTVLKTACSRISGALSEQFQKFCKEQKFWLDDYALYMSIKDYHGGQSWKEWPETLQKREKDSLEAIHQELTDEILFWKKVQFLFFYQWDRLKAYAEENNIKIIGDLPIYVSYDSADVWAHPEEFQLDENL